MNEPGAPNNFITDAIRRDNEAGTYGGRIQTRFPPEPNGFLHIGHAKAIVVDFGTAEDFGGTCMLRLDDTNPETEEEAFVNSIVEDIEWLGYEPSEVRHTSDYFEALHDWAVQLIEKGLAYVDDQDGETISATRGSFNTPGIESPFRNRSVAENLDLFERMRAGEFPDGSRVLRAKIDMAHENMQLRDPVMYRIRNIAHHRTGETWSIYPTYDWAHGQSDAIEGVTHSICTLEFESHRPLYDWFLEQLEIPSPPRQYEFARLELTHTVTSKRRLAKLVADGVVDGWDDPRMPTIRGLRRRGYPAEAIRAFCREVGTTRTNPARPSGVGELRASQAECDRTATDGRHPALEADPAGLAHRTRRRPAGRVVRGGQQPGEPCRRHPSGAVHRGAVDRAGRFPGGPAAEVLPALPRS